MVSTQKLASAMQHLRGKPELTDWGLESEDLLKRYLSVLTHIRDHGRTGFRVVEMTAKGSHLVGVRCDKCLGPVRVGDDWCGSCRKLSFNPVKEGGPPFGLLNPLSAYPIPETALEGGLPGVASYLAAMEEVERLRGRATFGG